MGNMPEWFAKTAEMCASDLWFSEIGTGGDKVELGHRYLQALLAIEADPRGFFARSKALDHAPGFDHRRIDRSLKELRTLSYLLHPPALDDAGLVPAIRSFIDGFSRRSGIKVEMKLPGRMARLPRDAESAIFRIVQEALANVHRHSGSATAAVRLSRSRQWRLQNASLSSPWPWRR